MPLLPRFDLLLTHFTDVSEYSPTAKRDLEHAERIQTNERVPGHTNYFEKNGLRTKGDGEDHDHEPPMTFRRIMSLVAMAFREPTRHFMPGISTDTRKFGLVVRSLSTSSAEFHHTSMPT